MATAGERKENTAAGREERTRGGNNRGEETRGSRRKQERRVEQKNEDILQEHSAFSEHLYVRQAGHNFLP